MQQIPGGPQATVRNGSGEILRILSPIQTAAYPDLGEYVRSMSARTITLHTAFSGTPFTTSLYSGTFAADGSLELTGTTNPPGEAPATISFEGPKLIEDIYTGAGTPYNMEGTIRRDVYAGFATGLWGGKYGNDALSFCNDPMTTGQGSWCQNGFNQPSFGDSRAALSPFPTCEQYAAVIDEFSDVYGNPYSDAAKKVTVSLDQPVSGGEVETLQLTIQPDSGNAQPVAGGNSNCGAGVPSGPSGTAGKGTAAAVNLRLAKKARVRGALARLGRISCGGPCGRVTVLAKKGKRVGRPRQVGRLLLAAEADPAPDQARQAPARRARAPEGDAAHHRLSSRRQDRRSHPQGAAAAPALTCDQTVTYSGAMDEVFKALADPTRRELLDELFRQDGQSLSALEERLPMSRFGVMKHLKVLEEAGLVTTRRRGREKLHYLNPVPIRLVHDRWVSKYAEPWASALSELKHEIEEDDDE